LSYVTQISQKLATRPGQAPRRILAGVAALAGMLLASPSLAASILGYQDVIYDVGYVSADGNPLVYTQSFEPPETNVEVVGAWLNISVMDDTCYNATFPNCDWADVWESEWVAISVDGSPWDEGYASMFEIYAGDITAQADIQGWGDYAEITVTATEGDAWVARSSMVVAYKVLDDVTASGATVGGSGPAIPEPSAALVFALGTVIVGRASRRR
jgi:hypothetical protein